MKRFLLLALLYLVLLGVLSLLILLTPWGLRRAVLPLAAHFSGLRIESARIELFKRHTLEVSGFVFEKPGSVVATLGYGFLDFELRKVFSGEYSATALLLDKLSVKIETNSGKSTSDSVKNPAGKSESSLLPRVALKNTKIRNSNFDFSGEDGLSVRLDSIHIDFLVCGVGIECSTDGRFGLEYKLQKASQLVKSKVQVSGTARLTEQGAVENYTLSTKLDPLSLSGFPVLFENGFLKLDLRGQKPFESENEIDLRWKHFSIPNSVAPSEGRLTTRLSFFPNKEVKFAKTELQFLDAENAYTSFSADGAFELQNKRLSGNIRVSKLNDRFLRLFPAVPPDLEKLSIVAELKPSIVFQDGVLGDLEISVGLEELQVANPSFSPETLRGTTLKVLAKITKGEILLENLKFDLLKGGKRIFDLSGKAAILQPISVRADLTSERLLVQELQALLGKKQAAAAPPAEAEKPPEEKSDPEFNLPALPPLEVTYQVAEVDSDQAEFKAFRLDLHNTEENESRELAVVLHARGGAAPIKSEAKAVSKDGGNLHINFKADTSKLKLKEVLKPAMNPTGVTDPGTVKALTIDMTMSGRTQSELYNSLMGKFELRSTELKLPSKFQNIPPFNLIFIPLDLVANITGKTAGFLLPEKLMNTATGLKASLSNEGQIHIEKIDLVLEVKERKVKISEGLVSPNLLPGMEYTGTIGLDGSLDLRVFLTLLGVRIPLPIAGSLRLPLPNAVRFVPELIRGLGLSALDVVEGGAGIIEGGFDAVRGRKKSVPREVTSDEK